MDFSDLPANQEGLTLDSDVMLCKLYNQYLKRRNDSYYKTEATRFNIEYIVKQFFPDWIVEDVHETARELARRDFLHIHEANNQVLTVKLTDRGVVYQERRFARDATKVWQHIVKLKPLLEIYI